MSIDETDQVINAIGPIGRWQWINFGLLCILTYPTAFPPLLMTFVNVETDYWCAQPQEMGHLTLEEWRNSSSPWIVRAKKVVGNCYRLCLNGYLIKS